MLLEESNVEATGADETIDPVDTVTTTEPAAPKKRHTALIVGLMILMVVVVFFLVRVVTYYVGIVRGNAAPPTSFAASLTVDDSLGPPVPQGDVDAKALATLDDPSLGAHSDDALLTIVEFADFGCPYSREASYVVRALAEYSTVVRYVYRDFPIADIHPTAAVAAEAGECAQEQGRFFDYHDKLYQNQFDLSQDALKRYAQELGLDTDLFNTCLESHRYRDEVEQDRLAGVEAGVRGTPTFFFNGVRVEGAIPQDVFSSLIRRFQSAGALLND